MSNDSANPHRVSLAGAVKKGLGTAYDHLGYVVFASFSSFTVTLIVFSLTALVARSLRGSHWSLQIPLAVPLAVPAVLVGWLCAVGVFYYADKSVYHDDPALIDTWDGIKRLFLPALGLFALDGLITAVVFGDLIFFIAVFSGNGTVLAAILAVLFAYVSIVWAMMAVYHLPLLVAQLRMESGPRPIVVLRKSFLLMADNAGFTVGVFLVTIALAVLCAIPALIGIAVAYLGAAAFVLTCALRELFVKYGIVEEEPEPGKDEPWHLPDSWLRRQ